MPCVWDTPFSGPICSGDAEQHDAPEELYAPAGSVVYGCDADVYLVDGALCGTGSWTLGRDAQMSVGGAGTFYMYYNVSVPEFLSPADPVGRSGSDTSSLSIVIPGSVFASAVVRMAPQSITYQGASYAKLAYAQSNTTSDAILVQSSVAGPGEILLSEFVPLPVAPGKACVVWKDAASVPVPLPPIPGVPDVVWSSVQPVTVLEFSGHGTSFRSDAGAFVSSLTAGSVLICQKYSVPPPTPPPPFESTVSVIQSQASVWVSLAASLSIVFGTILTLCAFVENRRRKKKEERESLKQQQLNPYGLLNPPLPVWQTPPLKKPEDAAAGGSRAKQVVVRV